MAAIAASSGGGASDQMSSDAYRSGSNGFTCVSSALFCEPMAANPCPARMREDDTYCQTGAALMACTGSTITVPLKRLGSRGRRTYTVVT